MKKKTRKKLVTMVAVPVTIGTGMFVGGMLPGRMGTTVTTALKPATGLAAPIVSITGASIAVDLLSDFPKIKQKKKRKRR